MKKVNLTFFTIISFFVFNSCSSKSKLSTVNERVNTLLTQMTLEDKIGQMNQYSSFWDVTAFLKEQIKAKTICHFLIET